MVKMMARSDDVDYKLVSILPETTRINISELAKKVGLSYAAIRNRILKLINNNLLDVKPVVSPKLSGSIGGILRVKSRNPDKLLLRLSKCNKVIGVMKINNEEIVFFLYSKTKEELVYTIDRIVSMDDGIQEFTIEYGRIPDDVKIPIRNPAPDCSDCPYYKMGLCSGCLPLLRIRNKRK